MFHIDIVYNGNTFANSEKDRNLILNTISLYKTIGELPKGFVWILKDNKQIEVSLQDLINEIRKQIEYVGENGTITKQTIDLLAIKQFESIIFDLTDSLGKKNISEALKVLKNLIYAKEPIQKIFITLYNHFKKIYITKIAIREKLNIAESLKLKPNQTFLANKYTMQSKYFKEEELRKILQEFINLDYKAKNGTMDINVGLEAILCRYCS